jgi:hydroxyacylglutathione hydrolase
LISLLLLSVTPLSVRADALAGSHIEASELLRLIEAGRAPTVVDVRTRREFDAGHVPGALHIPFWAVLGRSSEVPTPRESPIVLYCEHGPRAGLAKAAFRLSGFDQILYLKGHMSGWKKAGLPQAESASFP